MRTRVKICGMTSLEDALAACELGADAIGFVFAESPRQITVEEAADIADQLPPFVKTVGVFTDENPRVASIADWVPLDMVQLSGDQSEEFAEWLGTIPLVRVITLRDEATVEIPQKWELGSAYLLDACCADESGCCGAMFDWDLAIKLRELGKPIILAGGLNAENVSEAIKKVRPYGVDVSSGVESSPGKKDYAKIKEFIASVREADATA